MNHLARTRSLSLLLLALLAVPQGVAFNSQQPKPNEDRGLGVRPNPANATATQTISAAGKPEMVLQAGITSPQTQLSFSPDGRLLASMGMYGNAIKLWDVSSGRLLRQLESAIPSMGTSSMTRPFRFSADGLTLIAIADRKVRRWEVETGRELSSIALPTANDFFVAQLSEDGRTLAAVNMDSSAVRLWDVVAGREHQAITLGDDNRIAEQDDIALSPNGSLVAALTETVKASRKSVETTRQVTLWDVASGRKAQVLKVSSAPIQYGIASAASTCLVFSGDGEWLAMRDEASMKIWEVATGREVKSFASPRISGNKSDPSFVMFAGKFLFSPDRRLISFVTEDRKISLLDASGNATLQTFAGHSGTIISISFSADSKLIASSGTDTQIKLWDAATGRAVKTLSGAAMPIGDLAFSADGKSLSLAGHQAVSSWELVTGGVRRSVSLPDDYAQHRQTGMQERGCLLSRDGKFVIAGSESQPLAKIWELATGRELPGVSLTQGKQLGNAAISADGSLIALVERDIRKPGAPGPQAPGQASPQTPANTPPQQPIAIPDMSKIMERMQKDPKKMQEEMKKVQEAMKKGDLSAGMAVFESLGMTGPTTRRNKSPNNLRILDAATGRQLQAIPLSSGFINEMLSNSSAMSSSTISFSPDRRIVASSSGVTAPITLRDVSTGQELRTLKTASLSPSITSLGWSSDSKRLASAHWDLKGGFAGPNTGDKFSFEDITFSIKVWDAQTGAELNSLAGHNNFVNGLVFSRDGRMLASGGQDSTIKLWDLTSGRELRTLKGHSGSIAALDFSADGRFIVSGSDDGSARLWKAETGQMLATLVSLNKGDDWLVITPDGMFDGSPGGWNQILWRFSPSLFDVSPVEIFFNEYYYPGLLPDILAGKKIAAAADISQKDRRQPKLSFEIGDAGPSVATRTMNVKIRVTEAPAGARDVRLFRNGSLVKVWRGDVLKGQPGATLETTVSIIGGQNQFTAYAFNRDNVKSSDATLLITGADSLKRPATLHLLAVGVNQYANPGYNLKYAAADVRGFTEEVERQQRRLGGYAQIEVTTLLDKDATKANILHALRRLAGSPDKLPEGAPTGLGEIKAAEPEDAVIIFYAGHGTAQEQRFYLIPHDLGYLGARTELDEAGLKTMLSHSVSDLELEQACEGIDSAHLLMVIDACNSGQALEAEEKRRGPMNSKGLAQLAYEKGMYILTAAQSYQAAMEAEQLGHGYLTYALVEEGLKSAAADSLPKDGQVVLREWLDYATERVPRMQEAKMREGRGLKHQVAFVEGEEKVEEVDKRNVQRPRVFYRREPESQPMVVAKP